MPFKHFSNLEKQSNDNQDPLYRLFYREGSIGKRLLGQVKKDLADVIKVCQGELKQTNHLRTLISSLTKGKTRLWFVTFRILTCCLLQVQFLITGVAIKSTKLWASPSG